MKKVILTIATILSIVACEKVPTTTEIAEQAVLETLLDPTSWEPLKSEITDSITSSDIDSIFIMEGTQLAMKYLDESEENLNMCNMMVTTHNKQKYLDKAQVSTKTAQMIMTDKVAPIKKRYLELRGTENDTLVKVIVHVNGYATSRDGQRRIGTFEVEMSPTNEVLKTSSL